MRNEVLKIEKLKKLHKHYNSHFKQDEQKTQTKSPPANRGNNLLKNKSTPEHMRPEQKQYTPSTYKSQQKRPGQKSRRFMITSIISIIPQLSNIKSFYHNVKINHFIKVLTRNLILLTLKNNVKK